LQVTVTALTAKGRMETGRDWRGSSGEEGKWKGEDT